MSLRTETVAEFLREQCMRLTHGECSTRACLLRGGWKPGESQDKATCAPYEIHTDLARKDAALRLASEALASTAHDSAWHHAVVAVRSALTPARETGETK